MRSELEFASHGEMCHAWHYKPETEAFKREAGTPCVVMAHGFGGTRDAGLEPFAERFAAAGLHVLLFDYRHFGASGGEPRQLLSVRRQLQDWTHAIRVARKIPGVDSARIAAWGTSFSGGHVIAATAARNWQVAAVTAQVPMMDGFAALRNLIHYAGFRLVMKLTWAGLTDLGRALVRREPYRIPIVADPGELAVMTTYDALPGYLAIAPGHWRNEFCARAALTIGLYRPGRKVPRLRCPILIQVSTRDSVVPANAAIAAAKRAGDRAELKEYDIGHFDIYVGEAFDRAVSDQLDFFRRHLS